MKNIFIALVIDIVCTISFVQLDASQELTMHITIDGSKSFRKNAIKPDELQKWGRFYSQQALPFDQYFSVVSALYEDCLNNQDDIVFDKNLINTLPNIIRNDRNLKKDQRKEYLFPKFISKSFIAHIQNEQARGKKFQRKFYENKDTKKTLTLSYTLEYVQPCKETGAEDALVPYNQSQLPSHEDHPYDYVVDLLVLLLLIFPH